MGEDVYMSGRHRRDRAASPVQDQHDAAVREVSETMDRVAAGMGVEVVSGSNDDPNDPTMTAFIAQVRRALERREVRQCGHTDSPQPLFLNAWDRPYVVRCLSCNLKLPPLIGEDDLRCDTCGQVDVTGVWPAQIALGPLVISLGRCDDCTPDHVRNR